LTSNTYFMLGVLLVFTLLINLPFGLLRSRAGKYSLRWFLCIHLPIPFVYLLRQLLMVRAVMIPLLVIAAVIGQVWGGKMHTPKRD